MGFKPRPAPPPPPPGPNLGTAGKKITRGFVEKRTSTVASPGFLTRKSSVTTPNKPDTIKQSNLEEERPKSLRSVRSRNSSIPPSGEEERPKSLRSLRPSKGTNATPSRHSSLTTSGSAGAAASKPIRQSSFTASGSAGAAGASTLRRQSSVTTSGSAAASTPRRQSSFTASGSAAAAASTPRNSTKKTVFRNKVFQNGVLLYEWDQNPKFVSIYYPTPNADFTAFCNIFEGLVQLGTKPKGLPTKWFLSHDTGGQVDVEESSWKQCKQHCKIILAKENKGSTWARALKDDRVDDVQTIQKARSMSPSIMKQKVSQQRRRSNDDDNDGDMHDDLPPERRKSSQSPSSMKQEVLQRRRSNDDDVNNDADDLPPERQRSCRSLRSRRSNDDDDNLEDDDLEARPARRLSRRSKDSNKQDDDEDVGGERKRREGRRRPGNSRLVNRRSSSHDAFDLNEPGEEQPQPKPRRNKSSNCAPPRRKSTNGPPPRRSRSSASATAAKKPMPAVIFVDPNKVVEEPKKMQRPTSRRASNFANGRSRSCDSIDEELVPPENIEVDMNSDLVSVLGA
ncbi:unnamed protein product [Cylindrotheca closterium]|uniref:Uncharacterized protein n=1 Tax=Cylindrotheca closterium TaxID=2856 RepID=A0AAD2JID5_9STRA|nr:unnamed protein product [Cylindrotheca closterium]